MKDQAGGPTQGVNGDEARRGSLNKPMLGRQVEWGAGGNLLRLPYWCVLLEKLDCLVSSVSNKGTGILKLIFNLNELAVRPQARCDGGLTQFDPG